MMMMMKRNTSSLLLLLLIIITGVFIIFTEAAVRKQGDAMEMLWKRKATGQCMDYSSVDDTILKSTAFFNSNNNNPISLLAATQSGSKQKDEIKMLPGQPKKVGFGQYAGYVNVDDKVGRNLFYYFVEGIVRPSDKPLILWLNGGPGCSSLIGAMQEIGPFRVRSDGRTLFENPFAWNNVANVLFLENPAGVGFSYSGDASDYLTGDEKTAEDGYLFLLNWLERFPEYKNQEFYIAGESYAGHYVPQLAAFIHRANLLHPEKYSINLKGIHIGNALLNDETDSRGYYDYLWSHALISDEVLEGIRRSCSFESFEFVLMQGNNTECNDNILAVNSIVNEIDVYNIYAPLCHRIGVSAKPQETSIRNFDPCSDIYLENYMNLPEVQQALHANATKLSYPWIQCSNMAYTWTDSPRNMLPVLKELVVDAKMKVLVFSGDFDGRVPVTSTRYSLASLKPKVVNSWKLWFTDSQAAGFMVEYHQNLTFATVRAAGHMVPSYQPARSLKLLKHFIQGTVL